MAIEPDLEGFRTAQRRLRDEFSVTVVFQTPEEPTWPVGTAIDPETDRPYDPMVEPLSSGYASGSAAASVARAPGTVDPTTNTPIGLIPNVDALAIINIEDHPGSGATRAIIDDVTYEIRDIRADGIRETDRYLVYLEAGGPP